MYRYNKYAHLGGQSYLQPLRRLTTLLVSGNQLRAIGEHDLPRTLLVLAADHNLIEKIDVKAFDGMTLHKLFINNNKLPFLHRHTFDFHFIRHLGGD
ncbi:hypothetical protein OSTOST_22755 [Ostertagia ostertagi]